MVLLEEQCAIKRTMFVLFTAHERLLQEIWMPIPNAKYFCHQIERVVVILVEICVLVILVKIVGISLANKSL